MLRAGLATLFFAGSMLWGQEQPAQSAASNTTDAGKVDLAAAYYHYAMAQIYRETGLPAKANEEYGAALKADPNVPPMVTNRVHAVPMVRPAQQKAEPPTPQR